MFFLSKTNEPLGQRRYWPIYEAAAATGMPVGIHAFGNGGWPNTSGGWASYYIEEMVGHGMAQQAVLTSLILEGVFERVPNLKVVLIEGGLAWAAPLRVGLAPGRAVEERSRELPHLKRAPSGELYPHERVVHDPADRGARTSHATRRGVPTGSVGTASCCDRLSALGLRRSWRQALPIEMTEAQRQAIFRR